jgi:hypothetical protein
MTSKGDAEAVVHLKTYSKWELLLTINFVAQSALKLELGTI